MQTEEQRGFVEVTVLADEEKKWGLNYSVAFGNEYYPMAVCCVEHMAKKAEGLRSRDAPGSKSIAALIDRSVHAWRTALTSGTRGVNGKWSDVATIQRTKYAVQSPQEARGLTDKLKMMGPQPQQQQSSMF